MSTPIYFYKAKNLSNLKADSIVAVKNDNESAFSLYITDRSGIPYPLKDLQNNVILTNTDGNLQITSSSTSTNINLASSILASINSALQNGDNISELINDIGYLTSFTETDPIFQASEASLFVSGDKANLDNQSGVNSGDQTSIAGISGTKAEFNTELTDGDFLFVGDIPAFNPLDYDLDDFTNISADPFARNSELTSGITNLTYTPSATNGIIVSDTGTDATIPSVDFTNAGLLTPEEKQLIYNNSSTGVTKFEGFSINTDTTKYNTGLVEGWFIDNITNPNLPTKVFKSFPTTIGKSLTNISTQNVTYIAIDINGVHQQSSIPFDPEYQRDWIPLGVIVHSNRIFINAVNNQPVVALSPNNQLSDLMESIGFFNISGNVFTPSGANLNIIKTAGHVFKQGANFLNDNRDPHTLPLARLEAPTNIRYRTQTGAESSDTAVIAPNFWDNAGVVTAMTGTRWSIQRIYIFQSNLVRIQYGQATYENLAEAIQAIQTEAFVVEQNILENGLFRGLLIVRRNATNLSDPTRALFIEASRFGSVAGLGSLSTTSLQQAYNNSVTPEVTTDSILGAVTIKRGSVADTDNVFEIQNGIGTTTSTITGNGALTALTYNGYTPENVANKQNSLITDGTGIKYPTIDAVNTNLVNKSDTEGSRLDNTLTPIYAWGDSFTAGSGFTPYTTYLANISGFNITNKGVSGETSTQIKDRLIADSSNYSKSVIIWAGRNNYTSPTVVKADIATMIATLGHSRYLIVGIMNGDYATEYIGQTGWSQINQLNADLKALYGSKFVDIRPYIVSLHSQSTQDLIDFANDIPPFSLRLDNLHLNTTGYTRVAEFINKQLGVLYGVTSYLQSKDFKYYFENNNPLHSIGDENFVGLKTNTNTTATFTSGLRLINSGTLGSYVLSINNNSSGDGARVFNTSSGRGVNYDNASTGVLFYLNSQTGSTGDLIQFRKNGSLTSKFDQNGILTVPSAILSTSPTTSASTYDVLTRNISTGVVEKKLSSDFALASNSVLLTGNQTKVGNLTMANTLANPATLYLSNTDTAGGASSLAVNNSGGNGIIINTSAGNGIKVSPTGISTGIDGYNGGTGALLNLNNDGVATGNLAQFKSNGVEKVKIDYLGATTLDKTTFTNVAILKSYTVATLPTGVQGATAYVTDATAPTYLGTLTGGGSVKCPVFYDGTVWRSSINSDSVSLTGNQTIGGIKTFSSGLSGQLTGSVIGYSTQALTGTSSVNTDYPVVFSESNSGTPTILHGGNITINPVTSELKANSFIKSGGTALQFLKADGSIDERDYVKNIVKSGVQGSNVTGTVSETILFSKLIPANTFQNGDIITLFSRIGRPSPTASSLGVNQRFRINTSNTLTGSIQIALSTFTAGVNGNQVGTLSRVFSLDNGFLKGIISNQSWQSDIVNTNSSIESNAFNPTIDNYIFITGQLSFSGDTMYHLGTKITN